MLVLKPTLSLLSVLLLLWVQMPCGNFTVTDLQSIYCLHCPTSQNNKLSDVVCVKLCAFPQFTMLFWSSNITLERCQGLLVVSRHQLVSACGIADVTCEIFQHLTSFEVTGSYNLTVRVNCHFSCSVSRTKKNLRSWSAVKRDEIRQVVLSTCLLCISQFMFREYGCCTALLCSSLVIIARFLFLA